MVDSDSLLQFNQSITKMIMGTSHVLVSVVVNE